MSAPNSYKVVIPTAGTGSRLGGLTKHLNKSLVSVAHRPILSHIIDQIPAEVTIVIALGHQGDRVRQFLQLAYPERRFEFAQVDLFEGPGSGLGRSLLACEPYLQCPFIFWSCDTLLGDGVVRMTPDHNWMGYADVQNLNPYRTISLDQDDHVIAILEKTERAPKQFAYMGLAGICDYQTFWKSMNENLAAIEMGEAYGLRQVLKSSKGGIKARRFDWIDTGNPTSLSKAQDRLTTRHDLHILDKDGETIWFLNGKVIKFSIDTQFIANRVHRARELSGHVPTLVGSTTNMYAYVEAPGQLLSDVIDEPLMQRLMQALSEFWGRQKLNEDQKKTFDQDCQKFYKDKTYSRVEQFFKTFDRHDRPEIINGVNYPTIRQLLDGLNWAWVTSGTPVRFHGDLHFENILYDAAKDKFCLLDWRQEFGRSLTTGDLYYDLGKLLHGMIMSHELVTRELYEFRDVGMAKDSGVVNFDFLRKQKLIQCMEIFLNWVADQGYDVKKTELMAALIFLNIAALHHDPYCKILFYLGKTMLAKHVVPAPQTKQPLKAF